MQTVSSLRSKGILGVGLFAADCGSACVNSALPRWYYSCDATGACQASAQPLAQQVTNPVSEFALDNNGVVIDLPAVADADAPSVTGSLIFGIGTQADIVPGGAFDDLAGIASNSFGWGLPFFFGRRIYTAIESRLTSAGAGPCYAF
jgi:hypothetical protein